MLSFSKYLGRITLPEASLETPVDVVRYLEWIFTCPTLILLMAQITQTQHQPTYAIGADYLVCIAGFLGSILPPPMGEIFLTVSVIAFIYVVQSMWMYFTAALASEKPTMEKMNLQFLRWQSTLTWTLFPVVYFAHSRGFLSYELGEAFYITADVGAKIFFTLVLVNSSVEQAQNAKVEKMSKLTSKLEGKINQADNLLNNLLPESVVQQMKNGKRAEAEDYECVTVFFSDITNFTVLSGRTSTKDMMATLNKLWLEYDAIAK